MSSIPRLLLTGAAGLLGRHLRPRLKSACETLRVSDVSSLGDAAEGEEVRPVDLADKAAVLALLEGVDAIVHMGGVSFEKPFEVVLPANISGIFNLYEAARIQGVKRIILASSNHVTGEYRQGERISPLVPVRPDGYYGISKALAENMAQFYWDRYGVETVSLRIGTCIPEPQDRRALATWLSFGDLERLILASLNAPQVGHTVIYGMSANSQAWWDNSSAAHIGYEPQDSADDFRAAIEANTPPQDPQGNPCDAIQGGPFATLGPFA